MYLLHIPNQISVLLLQKLKILKTSYRKKCCHDQRVAAILNGRLEQNVQIILY